MGGAGYKDSWKLWFKSIFNNFKIILLKDVIPSYFFIRRKENGESILIYARFGSFKRYQVLIAKGCC